MLNIIYHQTLELKKTPAKARLRTSRIEIVTLERHEQTKDDAGRSRMEMLDRTERSKRRVDSTDASLRSAQTSEEEKSTSTS